MKNHLVKILAFTYPTVCNLTFFASKKGVGSTKNGRDSNPQYLGMKKSHGQKVLAGQILYRQRGTKIYPGVNVGMGKDHTLYAKTAGIVQYMRFAKNKTRVNIITTSN